MPALPASTRGRWKTKNSMTRGLTAPRFLWIYARGGFSPADILQTIYGVFVLQNACIMLYKEQAPAEKRNRQITERGRRRAVSAACPARIPRLPPSGMHGCVCSAAGITENKTPSGKDGVCHYA